MDATPDRTAFPWLPAELASGFGLPIAGGAAIGGMGKAWMQEVTGLLAARLRADADAVLAMGGCTTLTDLVLLQQRWLSDAGQAYAECGQRLARIAADVPKPAAPPDATPTP